VQYRKYASPHPEPDMVDRKMMADAIRKKEKENETSEIMISIHIFTAAQPE
jgi:hypothetical protein